MSLIYEKHEPASKKNYLFDWIKFDNLNLDEFYFLEEAPKRIELLNRYIIEYLDATQFIDFLAKSYEVSLFIKFSHKSQYLTKIQKLFKKKNLLKYGCKEVSIKREVFLKKCKYIDDKELQIIADYYFDSICIISKYKNSQQELINILNGINYFKQPKNLDTFCPTEKFIDELIKFNISVIFYKRDFCDSDCSSERPVFICYSPWKI